MIILRKTHQKILIQKHNIFVKYILIVVYNQILEL